MRACGSWYRRRSIGTQIFLGMAVGASSDRPGAGGGNPQAVGDIFIRLLMMAAIPLIFFTLMSGLTRIKEAGFVGRLTARILVYYVVTSVIAFSIAIAVMDLDAAGQRIRAEGSREGRDRADAVD